MAQEAGCDLVGIADLRPFKSERATVALDLLDRFANAISVAVHLDDAIIDSIEGAPTIAYAQHYRRVNATLDAITVRLAGWIESRGYAAHAIPASQVVDTSNLLGAVSHKAVARLAGMPGAVLSHARHALASLEAGADASKVQVDLFAPPPLQDDVGPSPLQAKLAEIDPDKLSPRDALDALYQLKKLL